MLSLILSVAMAAKMRPPEPPAAPPVPVAPTPPAPPPDPLAVVPTPASTPAFVPPAPQISKLMTNGASLWVLPAPALPLVTMVIEVPGGSTLDPLGKEGLASLSDRLMGQGAGDRDAQAFAETMERLGIQIEVGTTLTTSYVAISAHKDRMDDAMGLVADMVLAPHYKGKDFRRERKLAEMDVQLGQDDPSTIARRLASSLYFGPGMAWGRPSDGTLNGLSHLKLKELKDYHQRIWTPSKASITVAGALTQAESEALITKYLGAWTGPAAPEVPVPVVPAHKNAPIYIVDRPGSSQTLFYLVFPGVPEGAPTQAAVQTGTIALGGTFTSRLNQLLREELGYTYGVKARAVQFPQTGYLVISSRIRTDATGDSMARLSEELKKIQAGISEEEAKKAALSYQQDQVEAMGTRAGMALAFSQYHASGLSPEALSQNLAAMSHVPLEDVAKAMSAYDLSQAIVILVGDRAQIEGQLKIAGFSSQETVEPI